MSGPEDRYSDYEWVKAEIDARVNGTPELQEISKIIDKWLTILARKNPKYTPFELQRLKQALLNRESIELVSTFRSLTTSNQEKYKSVSRVLDIQWDGALLTIAHIHDDNFGRSFQRMLMLGGFQEGQQLPSHPSITHWPITLDLKYSVIEN